jgi:hypothetical protein
VNRVYLQPVKMLTFRFWVLGLAMAGCSASTGPAVCPALAEGVTFIDATSFDRRCAIAADCVGVHVGEQCSACTCAALNLGELACFQEQSAGIRTSACGTSEDACACATRVSLCQDGGCGLRSP